MSLFRTQSIPQQTQTPQVLVQQIHPRNLNIFIINAKHLTKRIESITRIIQVIAINAKAVGFSKVSCNTMRVWEKEDIQAKIAEYNACVSMEACGDQVYDQLIGDISVEVLSNMEKHKHSWKMISEGSCVHDINLIIEDDAIIMNEHVSNLKETLAYLYDASHDSQWDMLFWGMAQENPKDVPPPEIALTRFDKLCNKLIPSKEAYFINKQTAAQLSSVWCNPAFKVSYCLRVQLSKYLYFNTDIKAMFPNRRVTLDGSKLGLFPTTIHSSNSLIPTFDHLANAKAEPEWSSTDAAIEFLAVRQRAGVIHHHEVERLGCLTGTHFNVLHYHFLCAHHRNCRKRG
jgi:hypothetical protein